MPAPTELDRGALTQFVERIEVREAEKKEISDDIKDIFNEAKAAGIDKKALATVIKLRRIDREEREALDSIVETYLEALGDG